VEATTRQALADPVADVSTIKEHIYA